MVEFKENVKDFLPYNRKKYRTRTKWYGVSFQLPGVYEGRQVGVEKFVEVYKNWFESLISKEDNGSSWIVNHDRRDWDWFPKEGNNLSHLRELFKQNGVPNTFKGALIFKKDDLLKCSVDLISYPYAVLYEDGFLYENIDISHSELVFVIKISAQWDISILSTDKDFLKRIVNENSDTFILQPNTGTSLT